MANAPVKVNASIRFVLLKNPFVAALEKNDQGMLVLLAPSETEGRKSTTIQEMVDDIKQLMGADGNDPEIAKLSQDLTSNVGNVVKNEEGHGVNSIAITIQQAFLYYKKSGETSTLEYAFSLSVDTSKLLDKVGFFELSGASISVWNTDRKKVLETMKMFRIEDFVASLNG